MSKRKRINLKSAAAALGRKGGKAGTGKDKLRGDENQRREWGRLGAARRWRQCVKPGCKPGEPCAAHQAEPPA